MTQIYRSASGSTKQNDDMEILTSNFACSLDDIERDLGKYCAYLSGDATTEGEKAGEGDVRAVVDGCRRIAIGLLSRLKTLQVGSQAGRWKSLAAAVKSAWKEKELLQMESQLRKFRDELQWTIVVSLRKSLTMLESHQNDQFERLQSSITSVLWELVQSHSKPLPEWPLNVNRAEEQEGETTKASYGTVAFDLDTAEWTEQVGDDNENSDTDEEKEDPKVRLVRNVAAGFRRAEKDVLESLAFPVMRDRENDIVSAEAATFDWIFRDPRASDRPWSNFCEWLADGKSDGLYWISGKAGSGKSTLMKHLVRHERTRQALRLWAGGTKLLLSSYFFWYNSSSPEGGLREYWTLPRLRRALDRLVSQTAFDIKFAFFIDGLDEYAGAYSEIIETVKQISGRENVKICVSSRPLIPFEKAFASLPNLVLQNLTYDDIFLYVDKKLSQSNRMDELEKDEPGLRRDLTSAIVEKASGVFLWVYLVVRSLMDGLGNYDVGADLKRRLEDLPVELEELYWHMVDRVKPRWYLEEGFRLLRMVKASSGSVTLRRLCFAELQMPEEAVCKPGFLEEPSWERQIVLCRDLSERLKSRCLGLLEVSAAIEQPDAEAQADPRMQMVSFIHKSVFDFLGTEAAQSRIQACPGQAAFQPEVALLRASILELKVRPTPTEDDMFTRKQWFESLRPLACTSIKLAREVEAASEMPSVDLLRALNDTVNRLWCSVNPRTYDEENGEVHWISAHRLNSPATVRPLQPDWGEGWEDSTILNHEPYDSPGKITSFDDLCQKAGLRLYAKAVGLKPLADENQPAARLKLHCQSYYRLSSTGLVRFRDTLPTFLLDHARPSYRY
ncbi:hypothetical protein QBC34DRAFT_425918 [Podospora aff. communis PSN243]|uniref:NACHT domain-containing protein n=1 Tax=Podospora aff. communis PSN243 TaxID=3040156 RepID=A0AAV9GMI8_9PEZI|nr:hypothetical protein QBC34DRAFT_425918 [Podospora aff. communis PSN243]